MVNFNLDGLEGLENLKDIDGLDRILSILGGASILIIFFAVLFAIALVFLWVFSSIGIMNTAKKNNIPNPWLAFIPVGRSYLIGKLGFEVYALDSKKNSTFTWVTLGLSAASVVLGNDGDLSKLISLGLLVFESWAFYNMFKAMNPKNSVIYTVITVITDTLFGGIFLYTMKENDSVEQEINNGDVSIDASQKEEKENKKEIKKEESKISNYCPNCGTKLTKNVKFCPECGKKVN